MKKSPALALYQMTMSLLLLSRYLVSDNNFATVDAQCDLMWSVLYIGENWLNFYITDKQIEFKILLQQVVSKKMSTYY